MDGSVEGLLEGSEDAVEAGLSFLRGGPGNAAVERLEVTEAESEDLGGFEIR